ncbi:MAG: GNAT family N-acetyltransferase [Patescibacteria group bacterium]|nr:GNAT family N-acetyltransferase [Patescibacteria group bacterium]
MNYKLKEEKISKIIQTIFDLDNKIYTERYHLRSKDLKQLSGYMEGSKVYVAYDGEIPIGYIAYRKKCNEVNILSLAVLSQYRNKGIGKVLMKKLMEKLKKHKFHLTTHPANSRAIRFYLKFGFTISALKDNYYGKDQPRLILIKE